MKLPTLALATAAILLGTGCSVRDCGDDAAYLSGAATGAFVVPEGITLAPPSPAYLIPRGGEAELVLGEDYVDPKGKSRRACLYEPPRLEFAAEPVEEAPVEEAADEQG